MTDDQDGFRAPPFEVKTPAAVKAAGARLMRYALEQNVPADVPIVDMVLVGEPDEVAELARDQRLLQWYVFELEGEP